jgi:hypothetical protein
VDVDNSGTIDFDEFCVMMHEVHTGKRDHALGHLLLAAGGGAGKLLGLFSRARKDPKKVLEEQGRSEYRAKKLAEDKRSLREALVLDLQHGAVPMLVRMLGGVAGCRPPAARGPRQFTIGGIVVHGGTDEDGEPALAGQVMRIAAPPKVPSEHCKEAALRCLLALATNDKCAELMLKCEGLVDQLARLKMLSKNEVEEELAEGEGAVQRPRAKACVCIQP